MLEVTEIGTLVRWTAEVCGIDWEAVGFTTVDQMEECWGVITAAETNEAGAVERVHVDWTDDSNGNTWTDIEMVRTLELAQ